MSDYSQYIGHNVKVYYETQGTPGWAIGTVETVNDSLHYLTIRSRPKPAPAMLIDYSEIKRIIPRQD